MSLPSAVGKTYGEIWQMFRDEHVRNGLKEVELRAIHQRWINIAASVQYVRIRRDRSTG